MQNTVDNEKNVTEGKLAGILWDQQEDGNVLGFESLMQRLISSQKSTQALDEIHRLMFKRFKLKIHLYEKKNQPHLRFD